MGGVYHVCGIAGIVQLDGAPVSLHALRQMVAALRHRGPDAAGVVANGAAGLGHARLSILDPVGGRQPMTTRDGLLTITFNGEIFNYIELREDLKTRGYYFRTRSDTEVILHAYRQYGERCVEHFNGQWALGIWDRARRRLFVSRDRMGIRPLYYTQLGRKFLFASEIKALLAHPELSCELDPQGFKQVLTFWCPLAPTTMFRGIRELPPGHNLVLEDGRETLSRYWQLDYSDEAEPLGLDACAARLLELLSDAARLRLRSDVPVGAYLSGGLDSSITTALIRSQTPRLKTFSVTFGDAEFDESRYQQQLVDHLGTDHAAVYCDAAAIARVFPEVIRHAERPLLRSAPAPLYLLSHLVRASGLKVVLTGEGADEVLGGYDLFKEDKVRRFCAAQPDSADRTALFARLYPYMPNLQSQSPETLRRFFRVRPDELEHRFHSHLPRWELTSQLKRLLSPEWSAELDGYDAEADLAATLPRRYDAWRPFCRAQFLETALLMPGYILSSQGDRMAMAHGVEGRFPFLDHRVVEFAATIPPRWKMRGLCEKFILKRAAGHLVPKSIVDRPKQPYRAPDAASFFDANKNAARAPYVDELLSPGCVRTGGVFRPEAVELLAEKARAGRIVGTRDNMALLAVLSTQLLLGQFRRGKAGSASRTVQEASTSRQVPLGSRDLHAIPETNP